MSNAVHEMMPFTGTPALGIMMLNDFKTYLMETDVTKLTWAQYMEVDMHGNGTGLLDYWGNARPSWHVFRFWGDLPIERMVIHVSWPNGILYVTEESSPACKRG